LYAQRYGIGLQELFFGNDWIPDGEIDAFFVHMAYWYRYAEYVSEQMSYNDIDELDEDVKWNPVQFNALIEKIKKQKEQEKKRKSKKK